VVDIAIKIAVVVALFIAARSAIKSYRAEVSKSPGSPFRTARSIE
jgi:hypothetical protein